MTSPQSVASPADAAATLPEFVTPLEDDGEVGCDARGVTHAVPHL
jgi:hypothetical protein